MKKNLHDESSSPDDYIIHIDKQNLIYIYIYNLYLLFNNYVSIIYNIY